MNGLSPDHGRQCGRSSRWVDAFKLMHHAIENPAADQAKRAHMVELECGIVDGKSSSRMARAVIAYMDAVG